MEKENSNPPMDHQSKSKEEAVVVIRDPMAVSIVEGAVGRIHTPKFVDRSKQAAAIRDAASSSADTVETGTQNALFWDVVDDEEDDWIQEEDLDAPLDVAQAVNNPWLEFLMARATSPEMAAIIRSSMNANTNNQSAAARAQAGRLHPLLFNVGAHANANNLLAAQRATARRIAPLNSTRPRRQALSTNAAASPVVFPGGTEEEDGNDWYQSIVRDAQRLEQMEEPDIQEMLPSSPLQLPAGRSESESESEAQEAPPKEAEHCGQKRPCAGEDGRELSLEDYCKIWGLHPSELDPDEPGPSTKSHRRVAPLADDEVAKFDCGICLETLPVLDLFHGMQCDHKFCVQCMATYIESRIRDGGVSILCPDPACKEAGEGNNGGVLNPEDCKKSIDFAAFCSWGDRLTEKAIPLDQRVYCPNPRCGLMLERTIGGAKAPCKAACPACSHLICTTCGLDWVMDGRDDDRHNCDEGKGAALVKELAAARHWKQCPSCKMLVEKIMGCNTMHCRYVYIGHFSRFISLLLSFFLSFFLFETSCLSFLCL